MRTLHKAFTKQKQEIKQRANVAKIRLAQAVAFNLIMETPVDTSTALSNWLAGIRNPKSKKVKAHFVGIDGSTHSQSSSIAYAVANTVIQRAKVGQTIFISNNIEYINLLNQGYSKQAPVNFIELAVAKSVNQLKGMKL